MSNDLDVQFLQRISRVESDLLSLSPSSVDDFNHQWAVFVDDLKAAVEADLLGDSTITLAYSIATRVSRVLQTFMDLEALAAKLMSSLLEETSTSREHPTTNSSPPITHQRHDPALPSYIKLSCDWLAENVGNPYPSIAVRDAIAQKSGAIRKDIDNWFIDARKRIGWNAARKAHFSNKRVNIVEAATRFYANDEKLSLSQGAEHALISIMKNADDLYCNKFDETILATRLAAAVKDLTPETKVEAKAERLRQAQQKRDRNSYPSPDRSPEPSHSSPVPCDDEVDTIPTQAISITIGKRRNLSVEPVELEESRQAKRLRLEASTPSSQGDAFPTGLPSPASSVDDLLHATETTSSPSLPSFPPTLVTRKHCLSESDGRGDPKRARHLPVGPRFQTVSDSLPLSKNLLFDETSFDGWFQQIFDRPEVGENSSSGFSIELGSLSDLDCVNATKSRSTSPVEQIFGPPTLEVAADLPIVLDVPWDEFDFSWTDKLSVSSDNLRQSNSSVNYLGQEPLSKPLVQDRANFQVSSQGSCPENEFETFFAFSNPSMVDPVVIPLNPASNETWDFSGDLDRDQGTNAGFANNNDLLASLDFSQATDFLSSPDSIFLSTLAQDKVRQEKEKEFRETYERVQRLALELQKDDFLI